MENTAEEKLPLPGPAETRRKLHAGRALTSHLTVGEWLDIWLAPTAMKGNLFPLSKPGLGRLAQVNGQVSEGQHGGAGGTRTHDRRIMSPLL